MCELQTSHNIVSSLNPCYDITYSLAATFFINAKSPKADTPLLQELTPSAWYR
jgi:hypothetical protein